MFYDFFLRNNDAPFKSADQGVDYRAGQGTPIKRPILLHCADDSYCMWKPTNDEADGIKQLGFPLKLISLNKHLRQNSMPFGKYNHNYSQLLLPILSKSSDASLANLGLPQLLELANFSSEGEQSFGILLSLIGVISLRKFGSLLLKLASSDPTHLLSSHPGGIKEAEINDVPPRDLFWTLLLQEAEDDSDVKLALSKLQPFFFNKMSKLEVPHQRWLLFFALPGALARHSDSGSGNSPTLQTLICQTAKINATVALEAAT